MKNMKLLDLKTGKYLELDKDFWFGGNVIILFENLKRSTNTYSLLDEVNACARFIKQPHTDPIVNEIAGTVGVVVYGGRYVLMMSFEYQNKEIKVGDIITAQTITTSKDSISMKQYANQIVCFRGNTAFEHSGYNMGFVICENLKCFGINGFWKHRAFDYEERKLEINFNFFEEYSRQLRNEPNKFDELKELLK
jgi:hypothetical protein